MKNASRYFLPRLILPISPVGFTLNSIISVIIQSENSFTYNPSSSSLVGFSDIVEQ